jgi:hypothetical protein
LRWTCSRWCRRNERGWKPRSNEIPDGNYRTLDVRSRNCAVSRLHLQPVPRPRRDPLLFQTGPPKIFPAVGDGAIEALEEVKPRLGAWNKIPDEIGRAIVRQRAARQTQMLARDASRSLDPMRALPAACGSASERRDREILLATVHARRLCRTRGTSKHPSCPVAAGLMCLTRKRRSNAAARDHSRSRQDPIVPRGCCSQGGRPQSAGPKLGDLRILTLVSKQKAS